MAGICPLPTPSFQLPLRASFYRGGTSRGVIVNSSRLAPFTQRSRDAILCSIMGSPDPDGRQIDGMGGGASSLSKVAVINAPGRGNAFLAAKSGNPFPGAQIAEAVHPSEANWDVTYRFGQVPIRGNTVDWGSTCGNLVAAVAHHSILSRVVDVATVDEKVKAVGIDPDKPGVHCMIPIRILTANNGEVVTARLPIMSKRPRPKLNPQRKNSGHTWGVPESGECNIAGVPGSAAPVVVETPLNQAQLLPTGNIRDTVTLNGQQIPVTIINAGLPVIFVESASLGVDPELLTSHPQSLDSNKALMERIENLRMEASQLAGSLQDLYFPGSAAPKVCLVHERIPYVTTGGVQIGLEDYDCLIRAVSVGQFHRTVPATTLSAIGVASAMNGSLVSEVIAKGRTASSRVNTVIPPWINASTAPNTKNLMVSVGQPAGISSTAFRITAESPRPTAILMDRTARLLMDGDVMYPPSLVETHDPFVDAIISSGKRLFPPPSRNFFGTTGDAWHVACNEKVRDEFYKRYRNLDLDQLRALSPQVGAAGESGPGRDPWFHTTHTWPFNPRRPLSRTVKRHGSRDYSTAATQKVDHAPTSSPHPLHLYRHLTRAVQRHNTLKRPHKSSLQRIFRDDFRAALDELSKGNLSILDLNHRVEQTILVLLSASFLNEAEKSNRRLVRRGDEWTPQARTLLANLATLTYHHLSPLTVMRSKFKPRLTGGTEKARSSKGTSGSVTDRAFESVWDVADDFDGDFTNSGSDFIGAPSSSRPLAPLMRIPRPARGPVTATTSPTVWDGQRPDKLIQLSEKRTDVTQARKDELVKTLKTISAQIEDLNGRDPSDTKAEQARENHVKRYRIVKGMVKTIDASRKNRDQKAVSESETARRLTELIEGTEEGLETYQKRGMFCGGARWTRWSEGQWLAP